MTAQRSCDGEDACSKRKVATEFHSHAGFSKILFPIGDVFVTLLPMLNKICFGVVLVSTLTGAFVFAAQQEQAARPLYYDRQITAGDLKDRTLRELTLMRNTIYARAGNPFRKKWLNDYFAAQTWYHALKAIDQSKVTPLDRKNAETIADYEAHLSRSELVDRRTAWRAKTDTPEKSIELRLISERLGEWSGNDEDRTPLEDPTLLDKQLTVEQLSDFSRRDLRLVRNLIYARHGRPFKSDLLKLYFSTLDWYKEDPAYTDARLTPLDKRNINLIRSVEDQLGGPLTDYEHKKEDGWFAAA